MKILVYTNKKSYCKAKDRSFYRQYKSGKISEHEYVYLKIYFCPPAFSDPQTSTIKIDLSTMYDIIIDNNTDIIKELCHCIVHEILHNTIDSERLGNYVIHNEEAALIYIAKFLGLTDIFNDWEY